MVRTAGSTLRVAGGKSTRKGGSVSTRETSNGSPSNTSDDWDSLFSVGGGLNPICPRETPTWQKPITTFFTIVQNKSESENSENKTEESESASSSKATNEVDMMEVGETNDKEHQDSHMIDELSDDDKLTANKENNMVNVVDREMKNCDIVGKKNPRTEDDYAEVAPRKKIKLTESVYHNLKSFEM